MTVLKNRIWFIIPYLLIGLYFTAQWNVIPSFYHENYLILLLAYFFIVGICMLTAMNKKTFLFDPFTIISVLYICIFIIYPLYDYTRGNLLKTGINTSDGCIKGTLIFICSFLSFYATYHLTKASTGTWALFRRLNTLKSWEILYISVFCWLISFVGCIVGQVSRGYDLGYLFSLGNIAGMNAIEMSDQPALLFLLMLGPTLVVSWLLIVTHAKSWLIRFLFTLPTMGYLFMRNGRWLVLIVGSAPIVYYFTKRKKSPSFKVLLVCGFLLLGTFSVMQFTRNNIATHQAITQNFDKQLFSLETYLAPLESDFSTYKTYYAIVQTFPNRAHFLLGKGMVGYTAALIVPRRIWKDKPDAPEREVVLVSMGEQAMMNGEAYPNVGIFYSEFGFWGCIFFMALFGFVISRARGLYHQNSSLALVLYAFLWPFCFQLVTRSVATAVYVTLFALIPFCLFYAYSILFHTTERKL